LEFADLGSGDVAQLRVFYKRRLGRKQLDQLLDEGEPLMRNLLASQNGTQEYVSDSKSLSARTRKADIANWHVELVLERSARSSKMAFSGELLQADIDVEIIQHPGPRNGSDDEELPLKKSLETHYKPQYPVAVFDIYIRDR
jgi:hypothetical protein